MDLAPLRAALDAAHAADPERGPDGQPAEQVYVAAVERWIGRLVPDPSPALLLAARAQHLERWAIPRGSFPLDRAGYHAWRTAVHRRQGERAQAILAAAGADPALAARVGVLVAKGAKGEPEGQALEDAACLVFLERELVPFAAAHPEYPRAKHVDIIRRSWRKMSPAGQALAAGIELPPAVAGLVAEAAGPG
jgi:tRNAThr (cytosine32-N3)-methyltransferase